MKIATWNVNGIRARFDYLKLWLEDRQPDIVGLQELKTADGVFPYSDIEELGYDALVHGQKAWNGVAVLVKKGIEHTCTQTGLPGEEDFGARLITAELSDLVFTTVYCPNGKSTAHEDFPRKLRWFDALASHFEERYCKDDNLVLCGDFNICPAPLDSWNEQDFQESIFHTRVERDRMRRFSDLGFIDVFRQQHPDLQAFSWWDYRRMAFRYGHGLRIDLILTTPSIADRIETVEIDRDFRKKKEGLTASDHAPVIATLRE